MPRHALSPLAAWALVSLPLLLTVAGLFAGIGPEAAVAAHFQAWRPENPAAVRALKLVTDWGNPAFYLVYAAILLRGLTARSRGRTALALAYLAGQILVSVLLERLLKIAIGRPRPDVAGPFAPWSLDPGHHSLPSGHTQEITLQAMPLARRAGSVLGPLALGLFVALMGYSRVALGWHHPTDLLAGLAVGSLGGLVIERLIPPVAARLPLGWSA